METNRIEYKQKLTDHLEKEVVAFLNYLGGGIIYIGIDDNGNAIGINEPDQMQLQIKDRLKNNIVPSCLGLFDIVKEQKNGKNIIKLIVASGYERPYYIKKYGLSEKGTFIRVGVDGGGCSGLSYKLEFDHQLKDGDQMFEDKGIKIVVDRKSFLYLVGTELEYTGGLNGKGFVFNNPNASRTCGCGESFSV